MSNIADVKTHPISIPLAHTLWTAHEELKDSSVILVEVRTDDGIVGVGPIHGSPQKAICDWVARLAEVIRGMDATATVAAWEKMFSLTSPRPGGMGGRDGLPAPLSRSARPQIMAAMVPERRDEIVALGLRSIVSGTLATLMIGAVVGMLV